MPYFISAMSSSASLSSSSSTKSTSLSLSSLPCILLCLFLPATLSTNSLQAWDTHACLSWLKYFVVLAFGLTLDMILSSLLKPSKNPHLVSFWLFIKVLLLLWCLAPSTVYNGSDVIFDHIVSPIVRHAVILFRATQKVVRHVGPILLDKILENSGTIFEKILEYSEEIYNFLDCALELLKDEALKITDCLFRGLRDLVCSEIFKKTAFVFLRKLRLLGVWSKDLVVAGHSKSVELLTKGDPKKPRLISNLAKQLIYGKEEEQPKRLISDWFRQWRSVSV